MPLDLVFGNKKIGLTGRYRQLTLSDLAEANNIDGDRIDLAVMKFENKEGLETLINMLNKIHENFDEKPILTWTLVKDAPDPIG